MSEINSQNIQEFAQKLLKEFDFPVQITITKDDNVYSVDVYNFYGERPCVAECIYSQAFFLTI